MKIENFTLKKGTLRLVVNNVDFSIKGIYLLRGQNGSGKTTFIETVLKNNKYMAIKEKNKSIAYFSQHLYKYSIIARKYLGKENPEIVEKYCELFQVDYLDKNIENISGGEFVKLALIRCIAKDTPILIFDEPTNNLDNGTMEKVNLVLNELGKKKTVIVSTHDERLNLDYHTEYIFENEQIIKISKDNVKHEKTEIRNLGRGQKYPLFRNIFFSKFNRLMTCLVFFIVMIICFIGINFIKHNVPLGKNLTNENFVEILDIAEPSASYIQAIVPEKEFREKYAEANDHFNITELLELANKSFVEKVYVVEQSYINKLTNETSELKIFSIPNIITESPNYQRAYPGTKGFLLNGRLPKDNESEAVVSYDQMQKHWNYKGNVNDILGREIKIKDKNYTIVGITNMPIITISYRNNAPINYGVLEVSNNSKLELKNMLTELTKQHYADSDLFYSNVFILHKEGKTEEVMSYLVEHAPSYQYNSTHVNGILALYNYKKIFPRVLLLSFLLSLVFCVSIVIIGRTSFALIDDYIKDVDNQNFQPQKNATCLYSVLMIDYFIVSPIFILGSWFILDSIIGLVMLLPFFLVSIVMYGLSIFILRKKIDKKNV
jgi:ABC-type Mn2+/Zn2+ transport system ATPase subunit